MKALREPLWWLIALFIGLLVGLPYSAPLFSRLFPELPRPCLSAGELLGANPRSRLAGGGVQSRGNGCGTGGWGGGHPARRQRVSPAGGDHRRYRADLSASGGAGDGGAGAGIWLAARALIALALYGILPVLQGTLAGLGSIPSGVTGGGRRDGNDRLAASV